MMTITSMRWPPRTLRGSPLAFVSASLSLSLSVSLSLCVCVPACLPVCLWVWSRYGEGTASLAAFRNRDYSYDEHERESQMDNVAYLSAEFQSMHRLPTTHALVFTLHK